MASFNMTIAATLRSWFSLSDRVFLQEFKHDQSTT